MLTQIKFGTSGWRAVMAEEFTFANVRRAVGGIARYVTVAETARRACDCGTRSAISGRDFLFHGGGDSGSARDHAGRGRRTRAHSGVCLCGCRKPRPTA